MTAPSPVVRAVTYERDGEQCISCGARTSLQYQHRRAEGMGGRLAKPTYADGVTSCALCNPAYESFLQSLALKNGWKVRSWVTDRSRVPVFFALERTWYRLLAAVPQRERLTRLEAMKMMADVYGPAYDEQKGLLG